MRKNGLGVSLALVLALHVCAGCATIEVSGDFVSEGAPPKLSRLLVLDPSEEFPIRQSTELTTCALLSRRHIEANPSLALFSPGGDNSVPGYVARARTLGYPAVLVFEVETHSTVKPFPRTLLPQVLQQDESYYEGTTRDVCLWLARVELKSSRDGVAFWKGNVFGKGRCSDSLRKTALERLAAIIPLGKDPAP